jgi:16S rRNA (cytosine967-C5)-methyltransferase
MTDTRALAAEVLADVALHGASLRERLQPAQARLADPRDRALLTALCNEGARWWFRFDPALDGLLQKPLHRREPVLHALLVLGLVQLEILRLPPHAAVAATVEATRALGRGGFAKLVNAVLRRWLRERDTRNVQLDTYPETRTAHPRWLIDALARDWPEQLDALLAANNAPAPPMLRVNARCATRDGAIAELAEAGIDAAPHPWLRDALTLGRHADIARLPGFAAGRFSVQDGAAQCAADLLDLHDGQRVLDACAAPGGKTGHMLERADVTALALERDPARAASIESNLVRLGAWAVETIEAKSRLREDRFSTIRRRIAGTMGQESAERWTAQTALQPGRLLPPRLPGLHGKVRIGDAGTPAAWWDGQPFDRILLDAPCSATGVIRRHPDIKLHRRSGDIAELARGQRRLLEALWPLLAPGGRLVYATCSVLHAENEHIVAGFLDTHPDAHPIACKLPAGRAAGTGMQILPGEDGLDGMYYAVLDKHS